MPFSTSPLILYLGLLTHDLPIYTLYSDKPYMFLDRLLMESVTVLVPFDFINHITRTSQKTLLSFDSHIIHCIVAVSQFFCGWKYRCSEIPFWIFNSFLNVFLFPVHWIQGQRPGPLLVYYIYYINKIQRPKIGSSTTPPKRHVRSGRE